MIRRYLQWSQAVTGLLVALGTALSQAPGITSGYSFTTLAGNAGLGTVEGSLSAARFNQPHGVAADAFGNFYLADTSNHTIRKVSSSGVISTVAGLAGVPGSADGLSEVARFNLPTCVVVDAVGVLYVADSGNHTLRKITPDGVVSTFAGSALELDSRGRPMGGYLDGHGVAARFRNPTGLAIDSGGNIVVADRSNGVIRRVSEAGDVTTVAGSAGSLGSIDATGTAAQFRYPAGVAVDAARNIYVADSYNRTVRKITSDGVVTTLAGLPIHPGTLDGVGTAARFVEPTGIAVGSDGWIYVADAGNHTIRRVSDSGEVSTLAGTGGGPSGLGGLSGAVDGKGSQAQFNSPAGLAITKSGDLVVADTGNSMLRKVTSEGVVSTLVGIASIPGSVDQSGSAARFARPVGLASDLEGNLYVADQDNHTIRKITSAGMVTTLAGFPGQAGTNDGVGDAARFAQPMAVAVGPNGHVYVADAGNGLLREVSPQGQVSTVAGLARSFGNVDGTGSAARFGRPIGVAVDRSGNIYVVDAGNLNVRQVTPAGEVTTYYQPPGGLNIDSLGGSGAALRLYSPSAIAVDPAGRVFLCDGSTIRRVVSAVETTVISGRPGDYGNAEDGAPVVARFNRPGGLTVDSAGNLYVADTLDQTIRKIAPDGWVTTLGGNLQIKDEQGHPVGGYSDGTGELARFWNPTGIAADNLGNIYVADTGNNVIRKGSPALRIGLNAVDLGLQSGQFAFEFGGPQGRVAVVEMSRDMLTWQPVWTNTMASSQRFVDRLAGGFERKFYRVRLP